MTCGATETIVWAPSSEKPDTETTVLCWSDDSCEYFTGWWDSEWDTWRDDTAAPVKVTHWCSPHGPADQKD